MMKEEHTYTVVPTSLDVPITMESETRHFRLDRAIGLSILAIILLGMMFDDHKYHHHHYLRNHHHYMRNHHNDDHWWDPRHPTKLRGGGRDWLVNVEEGTIVTKHDPSLVLGVDTSFPLVLVAKGSPFQLLFGPPPKEDEVVKLLSESGLGIVVKEKKYIGDIGFRETNLVKSAMDTVTVTYTKSNFICLESDSRKMVLDVEFWNIIEGTPVNFVEGPHHHSFVPGGGRDFLWREDGSIATKLNPSLVLGQAAPSMVLVPQDSPNKIILEHVQELANGKMIPMTLESSGAVSKRYDETREFGPWHYIESQVVNDTASVIFIRFDGNYILMDNDELALDVSFWDMKPGTTVNFVGGDDKQPEQLDSIESSSDFTSSSSSDSSSSSSSDFSTFSSRDSSSSSSGDSTSSSISSDEEYDIVRVEPVEDLIPVKEKRMIRLGGN